MSTISLRNSRVGVKNALVLILGVMIGYTWNSQATRHHNNEPHASSETPTAAELLPSEDSTRSYVIEPPDILRINLVNNSTSAPIAGEHLVGPDGRVNLGTYGEVYISGMTVNEARARIEKHLSKVLDKPQVVLDVFAYNSKTYAARPTDYFRAHIDVVDSGIGPVRDALAILSVTSVQRTAVPRSAIPRGHFRTLTEYFS